MEEQQSSGEAPELEWRTGFILLVTPVLLALFFYYARDDYFRDHYRAWSEATFGLDWPYHDLLPYSYWGLASLVLRVGIPLGIIVLVFRESPRDYGYRLQGMIEHAPVYGLLLVLVLPFVLLASQKPSFLATYPFYKGALLGGWHFWIYEISYLVQFFSIEAFFRGFLIFGLRRRFGYYSVLMMAVPYCMIHFGKPVAEALGAIFAGVVLGVLALRTGSFYLGVVLHCVVALTMDLLAIHQMR